MKRKIRFYTEKEEKRMLEVYKTSKNQSAASRILAKEFGRNLQGVQVKLSLLLRKQGKPEKKEKGINIPAGFTFDIKPSKAVMFQDHVRLYF